MTKSGIMEFMKEVFAEWSSDKASDWAAAVAYYAIFSLAPLVLIAIAIAGLVLGQQAAEGAIAGQIKGTVGEQAAEGVQMLLASAARPSAGILATALGLILLFWGASSLFVCTQDALHVMWEIVPPKSGGVKTFLMGRLKLFAMVAGTGLVLLSSVGLSVAGQAFGNRLSEMLGLPTVLIGMLNFLVSLLVATALFAMVFRFLPQAKMAVRDVLLGALFTAVLFAIGKTALGVYLARSNVASGYGVAGSLIVLLLWINYSAQIFFLGAEFTQVYIRRRGRRIEPTHGARKGQSAVLTNP